MLTRGGKKFAVYPLAKFRQLIEDAEMLADVRAYDAAKARIAEGEQLIPLSLIKAKLDGESPLKTWRQYRGVTQEALAEASGVSRGMIASIEAGHKQAGIASLRKLAKALRCDIDNLV